MEYYIDIKSLPDEDVPMYFIRNKVYTKLHKALSTMSATDIGVSFPKYRVKLGDVIRIHGEKQRLEALQALGWIGGLSGYCEVSGVKPVPEIVAGYRTVARKQPTMTLQKLQKRVDYQNKQGVLKSDEDVKAYKKQYKEKMYGFQSLGNPFLELISSSGGHKYRRIIQFGELLDAAVEGEFDQFGLSKTATIPWF